MFSLSSLSPGLPAAAALLVSSTLALGQPGANAAPGAVYTETNDAAGNAVLVFPRGARGELGAPTAVPTGGLGTSAGLGNQAAVVLSANEKWLMAVNAGSHSISVFAVGRDGLQLTDVADSGGLLPISIAEHRGLVYVLNAASDAITGFTLDNDGHLTPLSGSTRALSGVGTGPAQVGFSPDGEVLVVTEKATNSLVTFLVDRDGLASDGLVQPSSGPTPFGFAFGKRDQLFVSEAFGGAPGQSAISSYAVNGDGTLTTAAASVPTTQTAACWVVVTPDGRYAYTTNAGSASISGYRIAFDGGLTLAPATGRAGDTGAGPIDLALAHNGRFLYSLDGGSHSLSAFEVTSDGTLRRLASAPAVPATANGLAAR